MIVSHKSGVSLRRSNQESGANADETTGELEEPRDLLTTHC